MTDTIFAPDWDQLTAQASALLAAYLRLDTTNPPGQEAAAAAFLADLCGQQGLAVETMAPAPGRANLLACLPGDDVRQPPLLLTHHMDVVTADAAEWSCDPFGGIERDGFIYGRGALDTKGLGIMHLLGLGLLRASGRPRNRDVFYLAVADEEANSAAGMICALRQWGERLAGATAWGEGGFGVQGVFGAAPFFGVAVAEKQSLTLRLTAHGQSGHGSAPHRQNANEILAQAIVRLAAWQQPGEITPVVAEMLESVSGALGGWQRWLLRRPLLRLTAPLARARLAAQPQLAAMLRDTVSVTIVRGGEKDNVIPGEATAVLDVRLLPGRDPQAFVAQLVHTLDDRRVGVTVVEAGADASLISSTSNLLYITLQRVLRRHVPGAHVGPLQVGGSTDGRWLRSRGLPTYGLAPIVLDETELRGIHGPDERISRANLGLGLRVVFDTLIALCSSDWVA